MVWCALVDVSGRLPPMVVEVVPSRVVVVPPPIVYGCLFSVWPRSVCHGETAFVTQDRLVVDCHRAIESLLYTFRAYYLFVVS